MRTSLAAVLAILALGCTDQPTTPTTLNEAAPAPNFDINAQQCFTLAQKLDAANVEQAEANAETIVRTATSTAYTGASWAQDQAPDDLTFTRHDDGDHVFWSPIAITRGRLEYVRTTGVAAVAINPAGNPVSPADCNTIDP